MEMKRAQARRARQFIEILDLFGCRDGPADLGDFRGVAFKERRLIRFASFAGAKTRPLRIFASQVELHIFRICETGSAGRPAIDAGCLDRIIELTIETAIARDDSLPSRVLFRQSLGAPGSGEHDVHPRVHLNAYVAIETRARTPALAFKS